MAIFGFRIKCRRPVCLPLMSQPVSVSRPRFRAPDPLVPASSSRTDGPRLAADVTFSVCLPAYQVAPWIGRAIASLLTQTHPAKEIIVSDDGSTDDLDGALAPFREHIILLRQENQGVAAARNAATEVATGQFVVFHDPDDRFLPRRLELLAELAVARPDLDILTTDALIDVNDEVIGRFYTKTNRFVTDNQRKGILRTNFVYALAAVRREALLAVGGLDVSLDATSDWDCWIRLILSGSRAGLVDDPLAIYSLRADSITSARIRLLKGRVNALSRAHDRNDLSSDERRTVRKSLREAEWALTIGETHEALLEGASDARSRALRIVLGRGYPVRNRVTAAVAAITPRVAGSRLKNQRLRRSQDPRAILSSRQ
jgi:glycosyltransferase involved in cell wall biosynthesis